MGMYIYTRRKDVKTVDGVDIVRFAFAYKPSYSMEYGHDSVSRRYRQMTNMYHIKAGDAAYATKGVKYAVAGDSWKYADSKEGMPIYDITDGTESFYDDAYLTDERHVGTLYKSGKTMRIKWRKDAQ